LPALPLGGRTVPKSPPPRAVDAEGRRNAATRLRHQALFDRGRSKRLDLAIALARDAKLGCQPRSAFESRVGFPWPRAASTPGKRCSPTSFGRGLDYYTGFEFELHARGDGASRWSPAAAMMA
jgi:hypothetical protein